MLFIKQVCLNFQVISRVQKTNGVVINDLATTDELDAAKPAMAIRRERRFLFMVGFLFQNYVI
ncbi:MAG: hypothetical protein KAI22_05575 [Gammaproteobacteria bacterium]|nr:hypothetical protein [Gammaproteobacteria bacterium]